MRRQEDEPAARLRKTARGWVEPRPSHCTACAAALGPGKVLVGTAQCLCGRAHRTYFCRTCEWTDHWPALGPECLLLAMDERNLRASRRADRLDDP